MSVFLYNIYRWNKAKSFMFFDSNPRALVASPLDKMESKVQTRDQIFEYIEKMRQQQLERRIQQQMIEDENFRFAKDSDYARVYVDPNQEDDDLEYVFIDDDDVAGYDYDSSIDSDEFDEEIAELSDEPDEWDLTAGLVWDDDDDMDREALGHSELQEEYDLDDESLIFIDMDELEYSDDETWEELL